MVEALEVVGIVFGSFLLGWTQRGALEARKREAARWERMRRARHPL